jgi:hydrophobic/amphiphilic exporter-1 (mainly G- bacteria), HAE1 family
MTLPEFSIRRHVMALMMSAVLVLFGIIGYQHIGVDRLPNVDFPAISISTSMPGGDPDIIDSAVTREIVRRVNSVPGIDDIQATSTPGSSSIVITFALDKDIDVAYTEVQTKVNEALGNLPVDAEVPQVEKVESDASPILWLSIQGDRTLAQLTDIARNTIRPQLEVISGVGDVRLGGGQNRRIRVEIDVDRLNAEGVTVQDLLNAIDDEHTQTGGGFLVSGARESAVMLDQEFHDVEALERLIIGERNGHIVRLGDVAEIVDGLTDFRRLARYGGETAVGLGVIKIAGTNTVEIIDEVKRRLDEQIIPQLPPGVTVSIASDQSDFINAMIGNLERTLLLAVALAAIVMWVFLKSFGSTLIIAASIPVSMMAVVSVMYFFGFTLNAMTMLALLLLVGIVVDDAIVVLENVYRHREQGEKDPTRAAVSGSNQVFFAIVASSLALISIFAPVIFMDGVIGRFFESFAVVVVFGILASTFVALTLIPMLCARYLRVPEVHGRVYHALENGFRRMDSWYRDLLTRALAQRTAVLLLALVVVAPAVLLLRALPAEFAPGEDEGAFVVTYRTPIGSSIEYSNEKLMEIEQILADDPDVIGHFATIGFSGGVNEGMTFVQLNHWSERRVSQQQVIDRLQARFDELAGLRVSASAQGLFSDQRGESLQFFLSGPELGEVERYARALETRLRNDPDFASVDLDLNLDQPQMHLDINREQVRLLGMSTRDVIRTVGILVTGSDVARYHDEFGGGERYRIRMKARDGEFESPSDLNRIFLRGNGGDMVRLDTVASPVETVGPGAISRFNLQFGARFFVNPAIPVGEAAERVSALATELMPPATT